MGDLHVAYIWQEYINIGRCWYLDTFKGLKVNTFIKFNIWYYHCMLDKGWI